MTKLEELEKKKKISEKSGDRISGRYGDVEAAKRREDELMDKHNEIVTAIYREGNDMEKVSLSEQLDIVSSELDEIEDALRGEKLDELEQWLQLRREGRLSAMPLGMRTAMAAYGDRWSAIDMFSNGYGGRDADGDGNVDGDVDGDGYGDGYKYGVVDGNGDGDGYEYGDGNGNGDGYEYGDGNGDIMNTSRVTQRFYKASR